MILTFPARFMMRTLCIMCLLVSVTQADAADEEDLAITPYRPSVSNSADLPVPGQLEMELGLLSAQKDLARRHSLPYLFKLAFNPSWGVLIGGEARIVNNDGAGRQIQGSGDTNLVLKYAWEQDEQRSWGLELGGKIPSVEPELSSGKRDYTLNGIYSEDMDRWHLDLNLSATRLGLQETGLSSWQSAVAAAMSYTVNDKLELTGEWSGTQRKGGKPQNQMLFAFTYSPTKRLSLDAGFTKGVSSAANDWTFFTGIVIPVAKLF